MVTPLALGQPIAPAESAPLVRAVGLTRTYRHAGRAVPALAGADLVVEARDVIALSGASGSGKSTLLNVLCGWERPDAGELAYRSDFADGPAADLPWAQLALIPQTLGLLEDLTVRENVLLPARARRRLAESEVRADELLDRLGLAALADRRPDRTSLGEQQRAAISRALVLNPLLVLADEPTAHQDDGWSRVVLDLLNESAAAGGAVLMVSHDPLCWQRSTRRWHMRDGQLGPAPADDVDA